MTRDRKKRRSNPLLLIGNSIAAIVGAVVAALAAWLGYSARFVNHRQPLPDAVEAERCEFRSEGAGRLSYYVDRSGDGAPLALIHSINAAASSYEMRNLFEQGRGTRPIYALDLPGFGFSDRSDRPYTVALYTNAIEDFLRSEVGDEADVIAFSLSGEFAARVALQHPDLIRSLTLISPTGFTAGGGENRGQSAQQRGVSDRVLRVLRWPVWSQGLYDLLVTRPSIRFFLQKIFVGEVDQGWVDYSYLSSHQPGARFAPLTFVSGKLFTFDIRPTVYEKLTLPVLVLYDQDPNVRFDTLSEMLRKPNWRGERIVPTKGAPHWEKVPETVAALDRFWNEMAPQEEGSAKVREDTRS